MPFKKYLFAGLLVWTPLAITLWVLTWLVGVMDGIFIGASFTRQMRDAAVLSIAVYLIAWWALTDQFGVQGLWGAMIIYIVARAMALLLFYPLLRRSVGV